MNQLKWYLIVQITLKTTWTVALLWTFDLFAFARRRQGRSLILLGFGLAEYALNDAHHRLQLFGYNARCLRKLNGKRRHVLKSRSVFVDLLGKLRDPRV